MQDIRDLISIIVLEILDTVQISTEVRCKRLDINNGFSQQYYLPTEEGQRIAACRSNHKSQRHFLIKMQQEMHVQFTSIHLQ